MEENSNDIINDVEFKKEKRKKQLAILKASNQMLEEAKAHVMEHYKDDAVSAKEVCNSIDLGKRDNYELGKNSYNASRSEIDNIEYKEKVITDDVVSDYVGVLKRLGNSDEKIEKRMKAEGLSFPNDGNAKSCEDVEAKNDDKSSKIEVDDVKKTKIGSSKKMKSMKRIEERSVKYDFDVDNIPSYVQYDVIPLPSNGECYPHKISRIPVAYLTAADENIYTSPNMYRDGKVIDTILKRKILDKRFDVESLCSGDRDAIILWLRATGYGSMFPCSAVNPQNGKQYDTTVDLSKLKYYDFDLKGDENGFFEYKDGLGNVFKFKYLTNDEKNELRDIVFENESLSKILDIKNGIDLIEKVVLEFEEYDEYVDALENFKNFKGWVERNISDDIDEERIHGEFITRQMQMHTVSINGIEDRNYIDTFIENMRVKDASDYREFISNNQPGVNFEIDVNIPESDGGGSFKSFLRFGDTVFIHQ